MELLHPIETLHPGVKAERISNNLFQIFRFPSKIPVGRGWGIEFYPELSAQPHTR
jgi:hypothetical protein